MKRIIWGVIAVCILLIGVLGVVSAQCTDSDGSWANYNVKGVCNDGITNATDYCLNDNGPHQGWLREYGCGMSSDRCESTDYQCPNGCSDGACINGTKTEEDMHQTITSTGTYNVKQGDFIKINRINVKIYEIGWESSDHLKLIVRFNADNAEACNLHEGEDCNFSYGSVMQTSPNNINIEVNSISNDETNVTNSSASITIINSNNNPITTPSTYQIIYDDNPKDLLNAINLEKKISSGENINFPIFKSAEKNKADLENAVSVYIYNKSALVIYGTTSPNSDVALATRITKILNTIQIPNVLFSSKEIYSDNFKDIISKINFPPINETPTPSTTTCVDSQPDRDYFTPGNTKIYSSSGELIDTSYDTCFNSIDNYALYPSDCYDETGKRGNGQCLIRVYCDNGVNKNKFIMCAGGCQEQTYLGQPNLGGACIPVNINFSQNNTPIDIPQDKIYENKSDTSPKEVRITVTCSGCQLDNKCYPLGFRKNSTYCDDSSSNFITEKQPNSNCENNFECDSNLCVNNQCVSGSLWAKILSWFSHLFGGK